MKYDLIPPGEAYYTLVVLGLAAALGIISSTLPLLKRIMGPEVMRNSRCFPPRPPRRCPTVACPICRPDSVDERRPPCPVSGSLAAFKACERAISASWQQCDRPREADDGEVSPVEGCDG
ncbi:hypothetical protein, partial [Frankia sp. CiP3]|uniref:hypothetical protein n=1 Tax=Frankia sp. CiP3 TaxID=2880971 RepID=UPI001EF598F8